MSDTFVNLTPHTLTVLGDDGNVITDIPPSGDVARVDVQRTQTGTVAGIPVYDSVFGNVQDLPAPQDGVFYVVSGMVRSAVDRDDVLSPGALVRDDDGRPVGCKGFTR